MFVVEGLGCRVWGLGFGVWGLGLGFVVEGLGLKGRKHGCDCPNADLNGVGGHAAVGVGARPTDTPLAGVPGHGLRREEEREEDRHLTPSGDMSDYRANRIDGQTTEQIA